MNMMIFKDFGSISNYLPAIRDLSYLNLQEFKFIELIKCFSSYPVNPVKKIFRITILTESYR